jgi:hypothetical protein
MVIRPSVFEVVGHAIGGLAWVAFLSGAGVFVLGRGAALVGRGSWVGGAAMVLLILGAALLALALVAVRRWLWPFVLSSNRGPYFRIDSRGLECLRGSVRWAQVKSIAFLREPELNGPGVPWLIIQLYKTEQPGPASRAYRDGLEVSRVTASGLELTVWHCRRQALEALRRFYQGQVKFGTARATLD